MRGPIEVIIHRCYVFGNTSIAVYSPAVQPPAESVYFIRFFVAVYAVYSPTIVIARIYAPRWPAYTAKMPNVDIDIKWIGDPQA